AGPCGARGTLSEGLPFPHSDRRPAPSRSTSCRRARAHLLRGGDDRLDDVLVARAPAEVALKPDPDLFGREHTRVLPDEAVRSEDHPGRAVAALQSVLFVEGPLEWMKLPVRGQALDRGDLPPVGLNGEHGAGLDRLPVHQDGARPTRGCVAPDVRPGEAQGLSNEVYEELSRLDGGLPAVTVDGDGDLSHHAPPLSP